MQFSSISCKTIQLDQKWCYLAEIWSKSSEYGGKQFQVAFFLYFKYFWRYGNYRSKNAEILQNLAFLADFYQKIAISDKILQISTKSYLELFATIFR